VTRWLITGRGGQLATAFEGLLAADPQAELAFMDEAQTDLRDRQAVTRLVRAARPDVVLHTAAYTAVDDAETNAETAFAVNEGGTRNLVEALRDTPGTDREPPPLVYFSSDYVFDGRKGRPYVESDAPAPLSVYGRSKLAGEVATLQWPGGIVVRTAWLFSPTGNNFVKTILRVAGERVAAARSGAGAADPAARAEPLRVVDDQVGSPTYAPHLAVAVLELLVGGVRPGICHLAGSGFCSWQEFAQEIVRCAGLPVDVEPQSTADLGRPAPRPAFSALASERGLPMLPPWQDGVAAAVEALQTAGTRPG
jgi:dTDP-4-dehydrorhamnose reductase